MSRFHEFYRVLNWFCFLCHTLRYKNINYTKLFYSDIQLPAYTAYRSLEKITNLMVRHLTRTYFLESCGSQGSVTIYKQSRKNHISRNKYWNFQYLYRLCNPIQTYVVSLFLNNLSELWERFHNLPLSFMIIARFSPFFPNSIFLIMKSSSKSTTEK